MLSWPKGSPWLNQSLSRITRQPLFRRLAWGVFFFFITAFVLASSYLWRGYSFKEGEIASQDIPATRKVVYIDEVETERLRNEAAGRIPRDQYFYQDAQVSEQVDQDLKGIYTKIRELQKANLSPSERTLQLRDYISQVTGASVEAFSPALIASLSDLLQRSGDELDYLESFSRGLLKEKLKYTLRENALPAARKDIAAQVAEAGIDRSLQPAVNFILIRTLRPNVVFDREGYNKEVAAAKEAVLPVQRTILPGQNIVRKGEPIDKSDLLVLNQLGLLKPRVIWPSLLGVGLFVLLLAGLLLLYLYKFRRRFLENDQYIILYGLLFVLTLLIAKGVTVLKISTDPEIASLVGYLVPLAGGAMLITVVLDAGLAVFTAVILSVLVGIMMDGQLSFVMAGLAGCLAGIFSISSLSDRAGLIRGGIYVSLANAVVILVMGLLNRTGGSTVFMGMGMGILNGFFSSVLTLGGLPYLEAAFGITSSVRLLELSNPSQPLLKRLLMEAPGTYHHSILVGNLAEAAAEAVQADPLLVRVGSYYHDIGKLKRPYFFIENQMARENPHDKIAPSLSTLIITSHVKDGLDLAREYKLPRAIEAIIEQHHGTGLVSYFYQRALESDRPELVAESDFRYDSVKPQSKEAALVMLADSVEAAIRSLQKSTPGRLEGLTRKIIKEKLQDGQLDECDLTFKDLDRIATAFVRVLGGIFHSRIEYPESMINEIERRRSRGAAINQ
ncbi:MAG TPA: HDIG domain-containing protein [Syntrophomonadaceae bacterium]|nr:HDIG domain-containing protein [Syntrophomonadaceae bacterium]